MLLRSRIPLSCAVLLCALTLCLAPANAGSQTFDLSWSGASFGNTAVATGAITFDPTVLDPINTNDQTVLFVSPPNPFATAFSITISGASAGNGTFGLGDFDT